MCAKDFGNILRVRTKSDPRTCNTLAHKPISAKEGCRTSIEWIPDHTGFLDRPFREDGKTATEDAAVVVFAVREEVSGLLPDAVIIFLGPALLQTNDLGEWIGYG